MMEKYRNVSKGSGDGGSYKTAEKTHYIVPLPDKVVVKWFVVHFTGVCFYKSLETFSRALYTTLLPHCLANVAGGKKNFKYISFKKLLF